MTQTHSGPAIIRFDTPRQRFIVLCPAGHVVTGGSTAFDSGFAGGFMQGRITAHQAGTKPWIVECDGGL